MKKIKISNFEMWSWDVSFVPFSEKVICSQPSRGSMYHCAARVRMAIQITVHFRLNRDPISKPFFPRKTGIQTVHITDNLGT